MRQGYPAPASEGPDATLLRQRRVVAVLITVIVALDLTLFG
jgi:hypothetical protein